MALGVEKERKWKWICSVVSDSLQTPWTVAYQGPLPMGFSRQEYWNGLPFPSQGDLPDSGIKPSSPTLQADALPSEPPGSGKESTYKCRRHKKHKFNPWVRKIPWRRNSSTLQYSCLGNTMDRGAGVTKESEMTTWLNMTLFFWAPKSLQMVIAALKLKDIYSLEGKLWPA